MDQEWQMEALCGMGRCEEISGGVGGCGDLGKVCGDMRRYGACTWLRVVVKGAKVSERLRQVYGASRGVAEHDLLLNLGGGGSRIVVGGDGISHRRARGSGIDSRIRRWIIEVSIAPWQEWLIERWPHEGDPPRLARRRLVKLGPTVSGEGPYRAGTLDGDPQDEDEGRVRRQAKRAARHGAQQLETVVDAVHERDRTRPCGLERGERGEARGQLTVGRAATLLLSGKLPAHGRWDVRASNRRVAPHAYARPRAADEARPSR